MRILLAGLGGTLALAALVLPTSLASSATVPAAGAAAAYHTMTVGVTVDAVNNLNSGEWFKCFDPVPFGCERADFYAIMQFVDGAGNRMTCDQTGVVVNTDFPRPGWTCQVGGNPFTGALLGPVMLEIAIWDFDGGLRGVDGHDGADLGIGKGQPISIVMTVGTSTVTRTGPDVAVTLTLTATEVPAQLTGLSVAPTPFDPTLGETTTIRAATGEYAVLDAEVRQGTTVVRRLAASGMLPGSAMPWDGRRDDGTLAPVGPYQVVVTATVSGRPTTPATLTANVSIVNRPARALALLNVSPSGGWNPRAGPVAATFSLSTPTSVSGRVLAGSSCSGGGQSVRTIAPAPFPAGIGAVAWNGRDEQGTFVVPAQYAIELSAAPAGGLPFSPAMVCAIVAVIAQPALELHAEHGPMIPRPGGLVELTSRTLDALHGNRRTASIELWVATAAQISSATPPQAPAAQCQSVDVCTTVLLNPGGPATATRFAYRAVASDLEGPKVETPWRLVDMAPATSFGPSVAATPLMAGVVSEPLGSVRQDKAIDIVFYPGSGYDLTADGGRIAFLNAAASHARWIMGADAGRFPSSALTRQNRVNVWVSPRSVGVASSRPSVPLDPNNLCTIGAMETAPFAEANGVIHRVVCRDNAPGNRYTANSPSISWHELHHAAFNLADEYYLAGPPEISGGYFESQPFPNLYYWPAACRADPLAGGVCAPLRAAGTFAQATRWWRIDAGTRDVMWDNTVEQATDIRRAMWKFDECDAGRC